MTGSNQGKASPSQLIDERIAALDDWRGETLAGVRGLIKEAAPDVVEEVKWKKPSNAMSGVPVWEHDGVICTGETYRDKVKLTFARGAALEDPSGLFNSSLEGNTRRAIDIHEGEKLDARAFKALVKAAVAQNQNKPSAKERANAGAKAKPGASKAKPVTTPKGDKVALLSGGNPQIAKGYGDAPVQAYIAAMPDWKSEVGRRLDAIIERTVPSVRKAVKWNSPFYGVEDGVWFLSFHVFAKYVKVTFFQGASLMPPPAGKSKYEAVRYYDIYEGQLDEAQFAAWAKQASRLPGERM